MERAEKLSHFQSTIQEEVAQRCAQIWNELEEYRTQELMRAEDIVLDETHRLIQKRVAGIYAQMTRDVSLKRTELKHQLYTHRDECVSSIFAEARERLAAFTATPEYHAFLLEKVRLLGRNGADGTVLRVRKEDAALESQLTAAYGHACTVETTAEITLGGVIAENETLMNIADESLDTLLEAQRSWVSNQPDFVVFI